MGLIRSGKTTIALHRAAFLRFADPSRFRPERILIVVSTHALAQYVSGVLPALGVSGISTRRSSLECFGGLFPAK